MIIIFSARSNDQILKNHSNFFPKDIRWCHKISEKFKIISKFNPTNTSIVSTSKNGCVVLQKLTIYYSLSNKDSNVEVMCESGYSPYGKEECGEGSAHSTLYIRTNTFDEGNWIFLSNVGFYQLMFYTENTYMCVCVCVKWPKFHIL